MNMYYYFCKRCVLCTDPLRTAYRLKPHRILRTKRVSPSQMYVQRSVLESDEMTKADNTWLQVRKYSNIVTSHYIYSSPLGQK